MAIPVYTLVNTTGSPIVLIDLGLTIPGSGTKDATGPDGDVSVSDLFNDPQLNALVDAGTVTLNADAVVLTSEQSKAVIVPQRSTLAQILHNETATADPAVSDDADDGYSAGSLWVNVTAGRYYLCLSATVGAANWQLVASQGTDVDAHAPRHLSGGADEVDGDRVDIDFVPTNYTRTLKAPYTTLLEELTSHLEGIDIGLDPGQVGSSLFVTSFEDDTLSSTTSSTFQQKATVNFTADAGQYLLFYDAILSASSGNGRFNVQVQLDNTTVLGSLSSRSASGGQEVTFAGHKAPQTLSAGSHDIDMDWRKTSGGGSISIKNARLVVLRVG